MPLQTTTLLPLPARQSGSAIVAALGVLALTCMVIGTALMETGNRFRTSHQSSCWSQAASAAEAGAEMALMSAQNSSWTANGWTAAPGAPGTAAVKKTFPLSAGVTATGIISADVSVDKLTLSGKQWLRIRSTGRANLPGGAVSGVDAQDVMLRKLSLRKDRTTGASVGTTPQATRTIEVLAEPTTQSPFMRAILTNKKITMKGASTVDSFDSSDPAKSTNGLYDKAKRQSKASVVVNDTQGATDLRNNPIYGDLSYTGAAPAGTGNVKGTITAPFSIPVSTVPAPTWTTFNPLPIAIVGTTTLTGGTADAPALYKVSSVNLGGNNVLTMAPRAGGGDSYIEVWVTGNFTTAGNSSIVSKAGVHVTYHVAGNVAVSGSGFTNQSNIAANNIVNVISPAAGVTQTVTVSGNGTFIGAINAPGADFTISGSGSYSGALIGKTMNISGSADLHYDEALSKMSGSASSGYRVASWLEAVR
jgi:hypothetical protein